MKMKKRLAPSRQGHAEIAGVACRASLNLKSGVIPQNFLFAAGERKFMRDLIWFLTERKPNGIPDKIAFPC
jgi:hypothetical protein